MSPFITFFMFLTLLGLAGLSLIFAFQEGWFDQFDTVRRLVYAVKTAVKILDNISAITRPNQQTNCSINNTNKSASITYTRIGKEKLINVPYRRDLKEKMRQWEVLLVFNNNKSTDITQEGGFPYICTAEQLGGKEIIARNKDTGDVINYKKGIIPGYLSLVDLVLCSNVGSEETYLDKSVSSGNIQL